MASRKWSSVGAAVLLAVAVPVLVTSASSTAQEDGLENNRSRQWAASWATAVTAAEPTGTSRTGLNNQTVRSIVHTSIGGERIRVRLSNIFGENAVGVGHATVAKPNTSTPELSDIDPATVRDLTFNGNASPTMLKGAELLSDPVDLPVGDLQDLVVTVYFPAATGPTTWHATTRQSNFVGAGDLSTTPGGAGFTIRRDCCWYFLSGVDVLRHKTAGSVVVLGDSMADGNGSTLNANTRWPDFLAKRLVEDDELDGKVPGVLNVSLAGNRLNHEGPEPGAGGFPGFVQLGTNAAARLNEDVFPQTGVRSVLLGLGINDIWMTGDSSEAIIASLRQLATQLHERGLRVVACTLGPYQGFPLDGAWTPEKEATRVAVNDFLRGSHEFDGLVDVDQVLRDPAQPSVLRAEFDAGDHIHPNDAGAQAIADAVPLGLLR
jgi:lysophospholipase L1-like esterase